jgi:hypothetical protein
MADTVKLEIIVDDKGSLVVKNFKETLGKAFGSEIPTATQKTSGALEMTWKQMAKGVVAGAGLSFGLHTVGKELASTIPLAMGADKAQRNLESALRASGQGTKANIAINDDFANQLQALTGIENGEVKSSTALAANMKLTGDQMREAVEGAVGLSTIYGGTLQSATEAVAKAYQGQWNQIERLIPELRDLSSESDKMAVLQKKMADGFTAATDAMKGQSGQLITAGNQWNNFKEGVGTGLLTIFGGLTKFNNVMTNQMQIYDKLKARHDHKIEQLKIEEQFTRKYNDVLLKETDSFEKLNAVEQGELIALAQFAGLLPTVTGKTADQAGAVKDQADKIKTLNEIMEERWNAFNANLKQDQAYAAFLESKFSPAIESHSDAWADDFDISKESQAGLDELTETSKKYADDLIKKGTPAVKDMAAAMKKYNDIQAYTGAIVSGITDVLGSLGYELTTTEQGFMDFGNSMINLGVAVASGNIAGIIAGVAGAVAGLAKALFSHKETYGEFVIRIEEERKAAEAFRNSLVNLSDTISNMSAWTDTSFENYIGIMKDLVSEFGDGLAVVNGNVESAVASWAEQFGSAFTAIISKAQQAGQEGSASLIEMFELLESNGLRVAEVQDYINAKLESAADAYADLKDMIDSSTVAQEVFGNISVPILDEILAYRQKVAENKDLVDSIGAATRMMVDFTDSTRINQGQFDQFSQSAVKSFDALKAGGMDGSQALQAMGPYLQRLQFMHEQYGFTIDANTQKILDQAIKEGKVVENKKTDTQQIIDLLGVIAKQLGGDIPDALGETSKAATGAFKDASKAAGQFNTELDKLGNPRNIYVSTKKQGDYEIPAASGGQWYVPGGSYTRFVTGEDEDELVTVTPKSKLRGGYVPGLDSPSRSGSDSASMTVTKQYRFDITINGVTSPEIVADHMNVAIERNVRGVRSKIEAL